MGLLDFEWILAMERSPLIDWFNVRFLSKLCLIVFSQMCVCLCMWRAPWLFSHSDISHSSFLILIGYGLFIDSEHILLAFQTWESFFPPANVRLGRIVYGEEKNTAGPKLYPITFLIISKFTHFLINLYKKTNDKHFQNEFKPRENVAREWGESRCYSDDDKRNNNCVTHFRVCTWRTYFLFFFSLFEKMVVSPFAKHKYTKKFACATNRLVHLDGKRHLGYL